MLCSIAATILGRYDHPDGWRPVYEDDGRLKLQQLWVNELDPRQVGTERARTFARAIRVWMQSIGIPAYQVIVNEPLSAGHDSHHPLVSVRAIAWPKVLAALQLLRHY